MSIPCVDCGEGVTVFFNIFFPILNEINVETQKLHYVLRSLPIILDDEHG